MKQRLAWNNGEPQRQVVFLWHTLLAMGTPLCHLTSLPSYKKFKFSVRGKVPELKRSLSWNRDVPMASRRGQILQLFLHRSKGMLAGLPSLVELRLANNSFRDLVSVKLDTILFVLLYFDQNFFRNFFHIFFRNFFFGIFLIENCVPFGGFRQIFSTDAMRQI